MPRIPQDELERLKRETDMVELLQSRGVELRRRGKDWAGRCPFHGPDEDPSLVVTPEKGLFHCFGCGASGSPVDLVMRLEGVSFRHAVELLREPALAGGQTGDGSPGTGEPGSGRIVKVSTVPKLPPPFDLEGGPQEVLDGVSHFYHQALLTDAAGLEYLERRGLGDAEALERFRVGFASGARLEHQTIVGSAVPGLNIRRLWARVEGWFGGRGSRLRVGCTTCTTAWRVGSPCLGIRRRAFVSSRCCVR